MEENSIIYGISNLGLLFIPIGRAKEFADSNRALLIAKTWGEFKTLVSKELYQFYLVNLASFEDPREPGEANYDAYDIPAETAFTPNDVVCEDLRPFYPEIEMSAWIPNYIQKKFGKTLCYAAMDMNVPKGDILVLDEKQMAEIVSELEKVGYKCLRDDDLLMAATTLDFDPDDYPELEL